MKFAWFSFLILPVVLLGCSVYESPGRKFLENNALEFAGVKAQGNSLGCNYDTPTTNWALLEKNPRANLYVSESEHYELRVTPTSDSSFSCYYGGFSSAQDMFEKTAAAIDLTLLNQSLGEFAFRPISHLK